MLGELMMPIWPASRQARRRRLALMVLCTFSQCPHGLHQRSGPAGCGQRRLCSSGGEQNPCIRPCMCPLQTLGGQRGVLMVVVVR